MEQNNSERLLSEMYQALHERLTLEDINTLLNYEIVSIWYGLYLLIMKTQPDEVLVCYRKNAEPLEKIFKLHEIMYLFAQRQHA